MRVRSEPVLEFALGGSGLAEGCQRSTPIGKEACPDRAGQILGQVGGVIENLLVALGEKFGLHPELDNLSLVDAVIAGAHQ